MKTNIRIPDLRNIRITDRLFGHYVACVAEHSLVYQWETLNDRVEGTEKSHCVENFRIAAGEQTGERRGVIFSDTDAYKWLEAVAYGLEAGYDAALADTADGLIDLIGRAQEPDGYLNTYYSVLHPDKKWTNLAEGHELYAAGHLIEAAVAYAQATGKDALLKIAVRFADLICTVFGAGANQCHGYPGHQEIELALIKLYRATGKADYLHLAEYFLTQRGREPNYLLEGLRNLADARIFPEFSDYDAKYAQTHAEPLKQTDAEGHAVRAMYMYSAMADLALETGAPAWKTACGRLFQSVTGRRMYLTGGIGSSGHLERFTADYDLPNDRMYCESCASVGLMMFGQRMAALNRDAAYYETVERALCNTVLAGIAADGDRFFYVNPLEVWPDNCLPSTSMAHVKPVRQPWFACACCPPNLARTLASLGQYIYAEDDRSVYINQFISSDMRTQLRGTEVSLSLESSCLTDGCVRITVDSSRERGFTLRVRIPSYFKDPVFTLDGRPIVPAVENGYAVLAVSRAGRQVFTLCGTVRPVLVAANPGVHADAGRVAVCFGPYVYCLEQTDNGADLANLFVDPAADIRVDAPIGGLPGALPALKLAGKRLIGSMTDGDALYGPAKFTFAEAELTAVPYCLWCNRTPGEMLVFIKAMF